MDHVILWEAFTSVMNAYHVSHITSSLYHLLSNGLAEKYVQIVKSLFYKAMKKFKCLMIYHNRPLSGSLQSPMQTCRAEEQDLTYACLTQLDSNLVCSLKSLEMSIIMNICLHMFLHIGQDVMYQDATSKWRYQATTTSLDLQPGSYNITTREGITYRKTQVHLKFPTNHKKKKLKRWTFCWTILW